MAPQEYAEFAIDATDEDFAKALSGGRGNKVPTSISVKSGGKRKKPKYSGGGGSGDGGSGGGGSGGGKGGGGKGGGGKGGGGGGAAKKMKGKSSKKK
jgi:hypothetical protein